MTFHRTIRRAAVFVLSAALLLTAALAVSAAGLADPVAPNAADSASGQRTAGVPNDAPTTTAAPGVTGGMPDTAGQAKSPTAEKTGLPNAAGTSSTNPAGAASAAGGTSVTGGTANPTRGTANTGATDPAGLAVRAADGTKTEWHPLVLVPLAAAAALLFAGSLRESRRRQNRT